jgi:hypothetical protein
VRWFPVDALPTDDPDMWELVDLSLRRLSVEGSSAAR